MNEPIISPWIISMDTGLLDGLPPHCHVEGRRLDRKRELHLTVMNSDIRTRLTAHPSASELTALVQHFADDIRGGLGSRLTDEAWVLAEGDALTVAVRADVPEMHGLYGDLRRCGLALASPVPHVTLFMVGTAVGIGLRDAEELARHRVSESSLRSLLGVEGPW